MKKTRRCLEHDDQAVRAVGRAGERSRWPSEVEMAAPSRACTAPHTLAVGCITAPANTGRKGEQRRARGAHLRMHPCVASLSSVWATAG